MKIRALAAILLVAAAVAIAAVRPVAAQSHSLSSALFSLRTLNDSQFEKVVYWSRNGTPRPFIPSTAEQQAEVKILDLGISDRDAVLAWLRGSGRAALYARGASDSDIGGRRPANMSPTSPTPTPNPYRTLQFVSGTIGGATMHGIQVLGGFAAVKRDGKAAIVCISFKNVTQQTARRVLFDFPFLGPQGGELGALQLDRRGEFSPGIDINGWDSLSSWQSGVGHRGFGDNCTYVTQGIASAPFLRAASVSYRVVDVEY